MDILSDLLGPVLLLIALVALIAMIAAGLLASSEPTSPPYD